MYMIDNDAIVIAQLRICITCLGHGVYKNIKCIIPENAWLFFKPFKNLLQIIKGITPTMSVLGKIWLVVSLFEFSCYFILYFYQSYILYFYHSLGFESKKSSNPMEFYYRFARD